MVSRKAVIDIKNELFNDTAERAMRAGKPPLYDDLPIVHRTLWRAKPPRILNNPDERLKIPVMYIVLDHTGTETCTDQETCEKKMRELQLRDLQERKLNDIQYSWVVGGDGQIYEGRGWDWRPPLNPEVPEHFDHSIEILFIGNYIDEPIPYIMTDPCFDLIQILRTKGVVHRFFKFERLVKFKEHESTLDKLKEQVPP
ncbi:peptidoglycan-recognition protein SD-like isoform X2 [Macrosteles quadrilineatus]|uniref:peptidoglycan-recognition protein SD-like isoform X2 n=1 Tax=Macrosteles quadrilineatus TaxID=74068 RepID=UPI0023E0F8A9|nr:peptidoglycan-recognition protein SD-like isoform X2 [Macrosteles quadrilineatus]XP_054262666.1 peptidoglycan-recognition protein SD-like isoform X2 [Macrosteles quadrilineatus]XP_054262667.1 peptidoglycan-recognition protein SD-like isoform X2 [Macrosteles quadrilineatus]XP_054262668.1 peptidoglycan-recognition protein SD-like isoform X2 [Macrosteles quadrilineatus]